MLRDNRGVTLIEMMISMVLLAIVSVALVQSTLIAMDATVKNELRDEAVRVAEQRMTQLRNTAFSVAPATNDLSVTSTTGVNETPVARTIRGGTYSFAINRLISQIDSNNRQVTLTVTWSFKNQQYQHSITTILRAQ